MRKFLITGGLFFVVFFIVEKSAYYLLYSAPKNEYDKRLENIINGKINKDLIVIGSSIGASNVLVNQLQQQTGFKAYNLSYPGSDIIFQEFILKSLLKFNKAPKKVILVIDNPFEFIEEKTLKFRFDRLYPLAKYKHINDELIAKNEKSYLTKFFLLARISKSNFKANKVQIPIYNPIDSSGSMPFIKVKEGSEFNFNTEKKTYLQHIEMKEKLVAFHNITKICKNYNIDLTYVFSPYYSNFNVAFYNRFKKMITSENNVFLYDTLNPVYKTKDYYFDNSHLLKNGAEILTTEISTFINNQAK